MPRHLRPIFLALVLGYIVVASAYVAAVAMKIKPLIRKTIGVSPSAKLATRPSA